jgi:hypothetical protein
MVTYNGKTALIVGVQNDFAGEKGACRWTRRKA